MQDLTIHKNYRLSIVVPLYNEADNVELLYQHLVTTLIKHDINYEIIFVDDGSTDQSFEIIRRLHRADKCVKAIRLSRNFGHQIAITSGMDHASGEAVITMDGDLQHPPEMIPKLIEKWQQGFEIVTGIRKTTEKIGFIKKATAKFFYQLLNRMSNTKISENSADFRLLDRKVVEYLKRFPERSKFIRGIIGWIGFSQAEIEYNAPRRLAGETKYTFSKMFKLAVDGLTSFSSFPLRISILFGLFVAVLCLIYIVWAIYVRLFTASAIPGWTSILISVLFLGAIQLLCFGMQGLYISRIYDEVRQRPLYLIADKLGLMTDKM